MPSRPIPPPRFHAAEVKCLPRAQQLGERWLLTRSGCCCSPRFFCLIEPAPFFSDFKVFVLSFAIGSQLDVPCQAASQLTCSRFTSSSGLRRFPVAKASAAICFLRSWVFTTCCHERQDFETQPPESQLTVSNDLRIRYRIVFTSFCWPKRWIRLSACSSIMGFHCGSRRYATDAAVRSSLRSSQLLTQGFGGGGIHPAPPQVIETKMTCMLAFVWNVCIASSRFSPDCCPSIRVYDIEACRSSDSMRSRVYVQ